ncbi:hypothetical protein ACOMHN_050460 [Nucella lapillus]
MPGARNHLHGTDTNRQHQPNGLAPATGPARRQQTSTGDWTDAAAHLEPKSSTSQHFQKGRELQWAEMGSEG